VPLEIDRKKLKAGHPPVVLLGGLGQVWPLGFACIPVVVATADTKNPALASRYVCGRSVLPSDDEGTISELLDIGEALRVATGVKPPLFCGNDHDLALTYSFRDKLSESYLLFNNAPDIGLALLDKQRFHVLAQAQGLPVPRIYAWGGENGVAGAPGPVIVKPRSKALWQASNVLRALFGNGKAKVFGSAAELLAQTELAPVSDLIVIQDYVPGNDNGIYSFHGLADQGNLLDWFLGRKIRTFPKLTGESSFIELIKDADLFRVGATIARRLQLTGPFKMDFKRHAQTGRYYLLEINARFTLWHYLGAVNGVNIPRAAYDYLVNGVRHRRASRYDTKYKWNNFLLDYHAYRELRRLGEATLPGWLHSLLRARRVQNVFSWKDPGPFLLWAAIYLSERVDRWLSTAS
jgi:D-aspartate ligase